MAYRFELDEPLDDGFRRIGCEQIDAAVEQLDAATDPHAGIHEARKALKRLRALLRLARPALRERDYRAESRAFRDLGRQLARARDSQAMLEALGKLDGLAGRPPAMTDRASRIVRDQRREALWNLDGGPKEAILASLREARRRFGQMRVKDGFDGVGEGLRDSYRDGRRAFARAYLMARDRDFHDWRKRVQAHWRHMQLLEAAWPQSLQARIELARELSQILGDDQDLTMLRERLEADAGEPGSAPEIEAVIAAARRRQTELRQAAEPRGRRLFADRPKAFGERMRALWATAPLLNGGRARAGETKSRPKRTATASALAGASPRRARPAP